MEDKREEIFNSLKMKLDILADMQDVFKDDIDPDTLYQLELAKEDVRKDLRVLTKNGDNVMDMYKMFGSVLFKAKVLKANDVIQKLTHGKEKNLVDLINEDQILIDRMNRMNNPNDQLLK
jgi:hypothetical protein